MRVIQNPVRDGHWASKSIPAFMAGRLPNSNFTTILIGNRIVGKVQNGVFLKKVKASVHFLHTPPAITFDVSSLRDAENAGAQLVMVIDKETGNEYQADLSVIWRKGFELDRGHGSQIALPLCKWSVSSGMQMGLWGNHEW